MSRIIKVDDLTYDRLQLLKGPQDTFSQVIRRLLAVRADEQGIAPRLDTITLSIRDLVAALNEVAKGVRR